MIVVDDSLYGASDGPEINEGSQTEEIESTQDTPATVQANLKLW